MTEVVVLIESLMKSGDKLNLNQLKSGARVSFNTKEPV